MALVRRSIKFALWLLLVFVVASVALVSVFRFADPSTSAVILAWEWRTGKQAHHQWQPLERISPHLQIAVIAAEDQKFPDHFGFDFASIRQALSEGQGRPRGASTISQQVAKNLFLWNGRSYLRKAVEAWLTLIMEAVWPKQRILEVYLNIAEFGEGVYGAQAAAKRYFGRPAQTLSPRQANLLAAVLPNPKVMSAARPSRYVERRAGEINRSVWQLGGIRYIDSLQ